MRHDAEDRTRPSAGRVSIWDERYARGEHASSEPDPFLAVCLAEVPQQGQALDVAAGAGRHALALARAGFRTTAVDFSREALRIAARRATEAGLEVATLELDLETEPPPALGEAGYDLVVVFQYLHRPLFEALRRAVRPGGFIVYKTYRAVEGEPGEGPKSPRFRLRPGELRKRFAGWRVVRYEEETAGPGTAALLAQKPV